MSPLTPAEITLGLTLGGITRGAVTGVVLVIVMQPFATLAPQHPGYVVFHAVGASMALSLVGMLGGIWAEKFDHI